MPYAYEAKVPENSEAMERVLNTINNKWAHVGDRHVGPAGAKVGYLCHGTSLDYMYDTLKVPFSFAFEILGGCNMRGATRQAASWRRRHQRNWQVWTQKNA